MNLALLTLLVCALGLLAVSIIVMIAWWQVHRHRSSNPFLLAVYGATVGYVIPSAASLFVVGIVGSWVAIDRSTLTITAAEVTPSPYPPTDSSPSMLLPQDVRSGVGLTVDIKANSSNGPITINSGDSYTYAWTSIKATSCQLTSPANSGIPLFGADTVSPGSPFYPAVGAPMILTVVCTDGSTTATDAVTIRATR
ncbi:MAG: hypothetical protein ACYC1K_02020 [Minisyncoccota bacterium]